MPELQACGWKLPSWQKLRGSDASRSCEEKKSPVSLTWLSIRTQSLWLGGDTWEDLKHFWPLRQLLTQDSWSWNQNTFMAFKKLFKIFKDLGATLGCSTHVVNKPLTLHWFWETKQPQFKMTFTAHCINTAELILMENAPKDRLTLVNPSVSTKDSSWSDADFISVTLANVWPTNTPNSLSQSDFIQTLETCEHQE